MISLSSILPFNIGKPDTHIIKDHPAKRDMPPTNMPTVKFPLFDDPGDFFGLDRPAGLGEIVIEPGFTPGLIDPDHFRLDLMA